MRVILLFFALMILYSRLGFSGSIKGKYNPFTGRTDFITKLDTTTIQAGSNITVTTTSSGVSISAVGISTPVSIANGGTNNSTAYSTGSVIFSSGTALSQNQNSLYWDNTNFRLGVNTGANPQHPLQVGVVSFSNEIPYMQSNTTPPPYGSAASSIANTGNDAWYAFDHVATGDNNKWTTNASASGWVRFDWGSGRTPIITRYTIVGCSSTHETRAPKTWTFEGSNDASSWTTLDTQTNAAAWTAEEKRTFNFTNTTGYRYYRLNVSANEGDTYLTVLEMEMMSGYAPVLRSDTSAFEIGNPPFIIGQSSVTTFGYGASTTTLFTTGAKEYVFEETGDALGTARMRIQCRNGADGAVFDSSSLDLVDMGFKPNSGVQSNFRLEHRGAAIIGNGNSLGEFQYFIDSLSSAQKTIVSGVGTTDIVTGKLGLNQATPGAMIHANPTTSSTVGQIIQGAASQTAPLNQWQNSSSIVLSSVTPSGGFVMPTLQLQRSSASMVCDEFTSNSIYYGCTGGASAMSTSGYSFLTSGTSTYLNAPTGGQVGLRINNTNKLTVDANGVIANLALMEIDSPSVNIIGDELTAGSSYGGFTIGNGITGMSASAYSLISNGTDTLLNAPTGGTIIFRNNNNTKAVLDGNGKFSNYAAVTTAGWGVPAVYGSGRSTAQTGDVASVATYTVGSADGSFWISANFNVTAYTAGTQAVQCTYTDETNTSRTFTFTFSNLTGTLATAIGATGPYESFPAHIRCKASTAITIKTVGTAWVGTYNVEGYVVQLG